MNLQRKLIDHIRYCPTKPKDKSLNTRIYNTLRNNYEGIRLKEFIQIDDLRYYFRKVRGLNIKSIQYLENIKNKIINKELMVLSEGRCLFKIELIESDEEYYVHKRSHFISAVNFIDAYTYAIKSLGMNDVLESIIMISNNTTIYKAENKSK